MGLLRVEAEKLSNNQLEAGIIKEIYTKDDLFSILPFKKISGKAYVYNREATISEGTFIDPVTDAVVEEGSTFTEVVAKLRVLAGDVDVDEFLKETMADTNDQKAIQIAQKARGLARKFRRTMATGDATGNAKEFDGLVNIVSAGQTIEAGVNGGALTLSMLDELLDAIPEGADALVMRSGTARALRALLRASGGLEPAHVMMAEFGRPMLSHNGIPVIINDFLAGDETYGTGTALASVYALRANEVDGLHGIYGGNTAGIVIKDIGTLETKDAERTRLKWYCGMALKSTKSLARIEGITNS